MGRFITLEIERNKHRRIDWFQHPAGHRIKVEQNYRDLTFTVHEEETEEDPFPTGTQGEVEIEDWIWEIEDSTPGGISWEFIWNSEVLTGEQQGELERTIEQVISEHSAFGTSIDTIEDAVEAHGFEQKDFLVNETVWGPFTVISIKDD